MKYGVAVFAEHKLNVQKYNNEKTLLYRLLYERGIDSGYIA